MRDSGTSADVHLLHLDASLWNTLDKGLGKDLLIGYKSSLLPFYQALEIDISPICSAQISQVTYLETHPEQQ